MLQESKLVCMNVEPILIAGREVLPLVEGGKGINVTTGASSGAWAAAGGVGTISGVNPDSLDESGQGLQLSYRGKTRSERHRELIEQGIRGCITQAGIAHETSGGKGLINMNILWEMGGAEEILIGTLEGARGLINGVTCGAGMPYRVAEIAARFNIHYFPIISSARAFRALWKRAFHKYGDLLGGVVYEDPWLAGGHNGLSNSEKPEVPEAPLGRVIELRRTMRDCGVADSVPVIMAGGVWALNEWSDWFGNPDLGAVAFQFGTRPLLTVESPISDAWKQRLLTLQPGDVLLHRFSPTGFYSSAVKNSFLMDLVERSQRQIPFSPEELGDHVAELPLGARGRSVYVTPHEKEMAAGWVAQGFTEVIRTPDNTVVFVTPSQAETIRRDQVDCVGCLSQCSFSSWSQGETPTTGRRADPRSFCIQKTLQRIGHGADVEHELMFAGHFAYRFATDPFYANGFIPTVQQLMDRMVQGL